MQRDLRCAGRPSLHDERAVLDDLDLVPLDRAVQDIASDLADPSLRSLDALHLASALLLGSDLTTFICYDHRLAEAARTADLDVVAPGQAF